MGDLGGHYSFSLSDRFWGLVHALKTDQKLTEMFEVVGPGSPTIFFFTISASLGFISRVSMWSICNLV